MKRVLEIILLAVLSWLSIEILLRRYAWHQWPTQVSPVFVYVLLVINLCVVVLWVKRFIGGAAAPG